MIPGYRHHIGDLRTGKITRRNIDLVGHRWALPLNNAGTITGNYPTRSTTDTGELTWPTSRSDAAAGKAFLAVTYVDRNGDETIIEAGPIWKSKYDRATGKLELGAAGLASYYDHRKVIQVLADGANPALSTVTYTGAQLGLIAKRLIELAATHTGGDLPVVLPSDADLGGAGSTHTRTYPGYELGWVGERLKQLNEVENGPDIQFVPRFKADRRFIEWVVRIGVQPTMMLSQTGAPWKWFPDVDQSPVKNLTVDTDGTRIAQRQWVGGQGQAEGRPIVKADALDLVTAGWPLLEGEVRATSNATDLTTLTGYAMEALAFSQQPVEAWMMTVDRDAVTNVATYRPGDMHEVQIIEPDYLPAGPYSLRQLSMAGDTTTTVGLVMSERLGAF